MSSNHNKNSHKSMFVPLAESAERSAYLGFEAEQSRTEVFDCKCICFSRGVIRISTQPRQKYKILTGRKNRLINHKHLFIHTQQKSFHIYLRSCYLLGRIIKIFISSNLQRRPRIFNEYFLCLLEC